MASWAELNKNNVVINVLVGDNDDPNGDEGYQWLINNLGGYWIKTSYNTYGGVYYNPDTNKPSSNQSKAFRKNYAGIGYTYDKNRDAFIPPKPYESWLLDEYTCNWNAPIAYPIDEKKYEWNEETISWVQTT